MSLEKRPHLLSEIARQWNKHVRAGLQRVAQAQWPAGYLLGLLPVRRYRLRSQMTAEGYTWWIEHDLPPYDRYQCAAYRVQMNLDDWGKPLLIVQSGTTLYRANPLTVESLALAFIQAGADPPLVISRTMGPALDP